MLNLFQFIACEFIYSFTLLCHQAYCCMFNLNCVDLCFTFLRSIVKHPGFAKIFLFLESCVISVLVVTYLMLHVFFCTL